MIFIPNFSQDPIQIKVTDSIMSSSSIQSQGKNNFHNVKQAKSLLTILSLPNKFTKNKLQNPKSNKNHQITNFSQLNNKDKIISSLYQSQHYIHKSIKKKNKNNKKTKESKYKPRELDRRTTSSS